MIRFLRAFGRAVFWLGRFRAFRPLFVLFALLWGFDSAVATATDAVWFSSLGRSALWQSRLAWQAGVFAAFCVVALGASIPVMRALARPVGTGVPEPPLPRALEKWAPARARATRWGWLVLLLGAFWIGRGLSEKWSDFALAGARAGLWNEAGADFWVWRAPALADALGALWKFGLLLGLVALGAGALRALPFLSARQSTLPERWIRALLVIAGALLALRALGFTFEGARALSNVSNQSDARRAFELALCSAGALGCLGCIWALRRPRLRIVPWAVLVLALPPLLSGVLGPLFGGATASDSVEQQARTLGADVPLEAGAVVDVPLWDEATLERFVRAHLERRGQHWVAWENVDVDESGRKADVVGQAPISDAWAGHGLAPDGALAWQSLELPSLAPSRRGQPLGPLFYGLDARPLLSEDARESGVPLDSWMAKAAWAWRLRDPLLLFEGARAKRLFVWRGARETGERLAPFWTWDKSVARRDAQSGSAYFQSVAYASTSELPRSAPLADGPFAGQNAVRPVAVLRMDARDGSVRIAPFSTKNQTPDNPFRARWESALPKLFDFAPQNAPTPALEIARAEGFPLVWMKSETGWRKRALPFELRAKVEEKLREFDALARGRVQNAASAGTLIPLEGATPSLWREGGAVFVARPFFTASGTSVATNAQGEMGDAFVPGFVGLAQGRLGSRRNGWGQTLAAARADETAIASEAPVVATQPLAAQTPVPTASKTPVLDSREAARQALVAHDAAIRALQAGRYLDSEREFARERQLLEPLTR